MAAIGLPRAARITADEILRAAGTVDDGGKAPSNGSSLLGQVVMPALVQGRAGLLQRARRINVEELVRSARM